MGRAIQQLPDWEQKAFAVIERAANANEPCPTCDDLAAEIGCSAVSTTVNLVQRLERRGLIKVDRYQRSRVVTITSTGKRTAEPMNKTPHWRTRPASVPAPSLTTLRQRNRDVTNAIMVAARRENRALADFLADMVWLGFRHYQLDSSQRGEGVGG